MTNPEQPETTEIDASKFVAPNEDSTQESTPIGDAAQAAASANNTNDDETEDEVPAGELPFVAKSYKVDVERALERETHDGPGDEDPGESDWISYATEGVEKEDGS